ncbi:hypothetical protein DFH08DRAFT_815182 [Mycena albidolilacea]|uniref:Uncharacterized protein n=1 Tax=Mycena albidolilacea TaxID=1033008 RepID=A0AAD6ZN58_9AGAR|nr:hypothetical protein DFH08DRAFT_815182 [Mycena albidolilacea]
MPASCPLTTTIARSLLLVIAPTVLVQPPNFTLSPVSSRFTTWLLHGFLFPLKSSLLTSSDSGVRFPLIATLLLTMCSLHYYKPALSSPVPRVFWKSWHTAQGSQSNSAPARLEVSEGGGRCGGGVDSSQ